MEHVEEPAMQNASLVLYPYLCQKVVGTEEHVNTIRMMNTIRDHLESDSMRTIITSGSFGEGLDMRGSDLDVMRVLEYLEVFEKTQSYLDVRKVYFKMETEDTQPGYTKLRLVQTNDFYLFQNCDLVGWDLYLSNFKIKHGFLQDILTTVHGPCVSDENGNYDLALCLHSKLWITPAEQWITRSNNSWPTYDVKQAIVKHGVLFVPIGVKGSTHEELEWRISFSVGEKLLIHTFTHTQLLCYALMKILLKDVIALAIHCKELLCSYFMKTILFWICEELPLHIWKPENLIFCFMRCFQRLIYCVQYAVCPHYFIPENNLFENKIQGHAQEILLKELITLYSYGWKCILLSDQISNFAALEFGICRESNYLHDNAHIKLFESTMYIADRLEGSRFFCLKKLINKVLTIKSSKIKYLYIYYMSRCCWKKGQLEPFDDMSGNKSTYEQYNSRISSLLMSTRHDAISGWLFLAFFFYKRKQYYKALHIVQYSLSKCGQEIIYPVMTSEDRPCEILRKMNFVQLRRYFVFEGFAFTKDSVFKPDELQVKTEIETHPGIFSHFLRFLCHYHLQNSWQLRKSLRDLQFGIKENDQMIPGNIDKSVCYNLLGTSFLLIGDIESARQAFMRSIELYPDQKHNMAFQKLSFLS